ncbi:hypothetical protein NL108_018546 [Boleophthalmus pectinirostris]|nr:hypothetical protein NL108_018546 [Boleophthalmus pectinirostris]
MQMRQEVRSSVESVLGLRIRTRTKTGADRKELGAKSCTEHLFFPQRLRFSVHCSCFKSINNDGDNKVLVFMFKLAHQENRIQMKLNGQNAKLGKCWNVFDPWSPSSKTQRVKYLKNATEIV